jgi:hypothetical protein
MSGIGEKDVQEISNGADPVGLGLVWVGGGNPNLYISREQLLFCCT